LSAKESNESQPLFSPNGKNLAFARTVDGRSQIYIATGIDLKSAKAIGDAKSVSRDPAWHPSNEAILFSSNSGGRVFNLFIYDIKLDCLIRLTKSESNLMEPAFSPDGRNIVFSTEVSGSKHLFMMDFSRDQASCSKSAE
ncbi:MAG TPA: hypothetical protein VM432_08120, partial [Bdellovibrionales bacterium]|nr:hypothetical protein [Bdellovibrionales bacterium]